MFTNFFKNIFSKVNLNNISNKDKPDVKTVSFDSEGNIINSPTGNPKDGTPEEVKKVAKELYNKLNKVIKK